MARSSLQVYISDPTQGRGTVRSPETGRFIPRDTQQITRKFQALAIKAQADVVANIASRIIRTSVSTGRLERVTANAANRYADQFGFGVGVVDYLNQSEAKYWRTIEEGSAIAWADTPGGRSSMVGMQLRGKFGGSVVGWRPVSDWGNQPLAGPKWGAQGGKLRWIWSMPVNENFKVRQEIRPMHAYADVGQGGIFQHEAVEVAQDFLRQVARRALSPSP